jgi:hypothetical protein
VHTLGQKHIRNVEMMPIFKQECELILSYWSVQWSL